MTNSQKTAALPAGDSETGPTRRRGRRPQESRRKLLEAARTLFVERGYHETRPQDISKLAGVGHGTFYLHFADKLDCFLAFTDQASLELEEIVERHLAGVETLDDAIREILRAIFEYGAANPGVLSAAMTDLEVIAAGGARDRMPADRWAEQWAGWLSEWRGGGAVADDINVDLAGHMIVGAITGAGRYTAPKTIDEQRLIDQIATVIARALKPADDETKKTRAD